MDDRAKTALKIGIGAAVIGGAAYLYGKERAHRKAVEAELQRLREDTGRAVPRPLAVTRQTSTTSAGVAAAGGAGGPRKPVRVYMDGVFDLMHYGHSNALRQARACGDVLVVGLVADDEVERNKGSRPVMPEEERALALEGCKFVDEVIRGVPYDLSEEWVNKLVADHNIDYIVHGDDPCITADGKDAYAYAKAIGKYKQIKRTEGVSTTDIVGRMLLMTREHHVRHDTPSLSDGSGASAPSATSGGAGTGGKPVTTASLDRSVRSSSLGSLASLEEDAAANAAAEAAAASGAGAGAGAGAGSASAGGAAGAGSDKPAPPSPASSLPPVQTKFLPTARRIMQFADGKAPKPDDVVVYMAGSFDMFNAGHIAALREARKFGTFLIVGVHDDPTVHALRGQGLPILNLYERTLSLLSCKFVDEVIIGAPWEISEDLLKTMNIKVVVRGDCSDMQNGPGHEALGWEFDAASMEAALAKEYAVPAAKGMLQTFHSPMPLTAVSIVHRIMQSRATFQKRYDKKSAMESDYYKSSKVYLQEA